jgi:uncharacterized protein (DUF1778 family)
MSYVEGVSAKPTKTPMTTDRPRVISVRLSETEAEIIERAAEELGLTISAFLRMVALERSKLDKSNR